MPNSRLIKWLLALSLFLIALVLFLFYRQVPHDQEPYAKAVDSATGICLLEGKLGVQLNKVGESWTVHPVSAPEIKAGESAGSVPAENDRVKNLLSELKDVQVEDVISDRPDRQAEFEINPDSGMRVVLLTPSSTLADGIFGKQAPDFTHIYFRFPDKPSIYLARGIIRGELGRPIVNDWRSRRLIDLPETKIQAILMEGSGFKTDLVRASSDVWTMNGKVVETGPVDALVGTLAHLQAMDFIDSASTPKLTYEGLTNARVVVKSVDSPVVELRIGAEEVKSQRYPVSTSQETGLAWLPENSLKAILQKPSAFKEKH